MYVPMNDTNAIPISFNHSTKAVHAEVAKVKPTLPHKYKPYPIAPMLAKNADIMKIVAIIKNIVVLIKLIPYFFGFGLHPI